MLPPIPTANLLTGPKLLADALAKGVEPDCLLAFFSFGIILRRKTEAGMVEYPVDPAQVATALSAKVSFSTGILSASAICVVNEGVRRVVVEYRAPQRTGIFLEGSDMPVRTVLPGLLLIRTTHGDDNPNYKLFAVKGRPEKGDTPLFNAPLPNISNQAGDICWGSVPKPSKESLASCNLNEDWTFLLGSRFSSHAVGGKSKKFDDDVRKALMDCEQRKVRKYPVSDLVAAKRTLADVVKEA